ncbi:MAG: tetratricopeptide repeat protein [bacterium]|nr:tetratricopeptide repeat protein [bacterium]
MTAIKFINSDYEEREKAQQYLTAGKLEKALAEFSKLVEKNPTDPWLKLKMGQVKKRMGKTEEAIEIYKEVMDKYAANGFIDRAIAVSKLILELDPNGEEILDKLAELHASRVITASETAKAAGWVVKEARDTPVVPFISDLSHEELVRIMGGLNRVKYDPENWIVRNGAQDDTIYIISSGKVSIYKLIKCFDEKTSKKKLNALFDGGKPWKKSQSE